MRQSERHPLVTAAVLGALPLLLSTGCSFGFGAPAAVAADEVADRSSRMLADQIGEAPDEFVCTDDLPAEVDAEIRCELTHGGESLGVTVTTTSVDGSDVQWEVLVDDAPEGEPSADDTGAGEDAAAEEAAQDDTAAVSSGGSVPATQVAEVSAAELEALVGQAPQDFACLEDLPARVGAEIRCNFVDGGMNYGATITTTVVDGENVQWDIQVDDQPL